MTDWNKETEQLKFKVEINGEEKVRCWTLEVRSAEGGQVLARLWRVRRSFL